MNRVYLVYMVPSKPTKHEYLLGVFAKLKMARLAATKEASSSHAYWWTNFRISSQKIVFQEKNK